MSEDGQVYDEAFFAGHRDGSLRSARLILPHLYQSLSISSVLDVGCGIGAWLKAHEELGASDVVGVDGAYVGTSSLMMDPARMLALDISTGFDLGRQFDLVECLEVAEHLPAGCAGQLVESLTRHG